MIVLEISDIAKEAIRTGTIKLRVLRSGMFQQLTFDTKKVKIGNLEYIELYTKRMLDISELTRIANEIGLPIQAQNAIAFPKDTSAQDFKDTIKFLSSSS